VSAQNDKRVIISSDVLDKSWIAADTNEPRRLRYRITAKMKESASTQGITSGGEPPAVSAVEINEPTAAGEGIEIIDQDVVSLRSEPLRANRVVVRFEDSLMVYQSVNLPVRTRTQVRNDLVALVAFGPQAKGNFNGLEVCPELILAAEPGSTGEFVVEAGYESVAIFLPPGILKEHLKIRDRLDDFRFPKGVEVRESNASNAQSLFAFGKTTAEYAARQPELFDGQLSSRAAAGMELLEKLLAVFGSMKDHEPTRSDATRQSHSRIVQIAEDYATSHTDERVSVTDLCAAAGASERTLQYAFQTVMGMAPMAYLTRLRLHRVRQALRKSTRGSTTVSTEALRWGFWHFGDFSKAYKVCFDETPSETLNRIQDSE
jgi:AraC family ethanolamine operon transcriptional activator